MFSARRFLARKQLEPVAFGQVDFPRVDIILQHGRDEERIAQHEFVLDRENFFVARELRDEMAHRRNARFVRFLHQRVQIGQEIVVQKELLAHKS